MSVISSPVKLAAFPNGTTSRFDSPAPPPPPPGLAVTTMETSVALNGITWSFDQAYEVGQFVNGDYFVIDPVGGVTVSSVSPAQVGSGTSLQNGSMVNPLYETNPPVNNLIAQHWDGRSGFAATSTTYAATFPRVLVGDESLSSCKSSATTPNGIMIEAMEVLTCLSAVPFADTFRPMYYGNIKTQYRKSSLNTGLLPSLNLTAGKPSLGELATVADGFRRPWSDIAGGNWTGRLLHVINNLPDYGEQICELTGVGSLFLCLDYTLAEKDELLTNYIQVAIDLYAMVIFNHLSSGPGPALGWVPDGGHANGRCLPILIAGILLNDDGMKDWIRDAVAQCSENDETYYSYGDLPGNNDPDFTNPVTLSANVGQEVVAFFGERQGSSDSYDNSPLWDTVGCDGGGLENAPMTRATDGCSNYRNSDTSGAWVSGALVIRMLGAEEIFYTDRHYIRYVDRWMGYGNDPQVTDAPGGITPGQPSGIHAADVLAAWNQYRSTFDN